MKDPGVGKHLNSASRPGSEGLTPHLHYRSKMGRSLSALRGGSGKARGQTLLQKQNFCSRRSREISQVLKAKSPIFLQRMRGSRFERRKLPVMGHPPLSLGPGLAGPTSTGPPGRGYGGQRALGYQIGVGTTLNGSSAFPTPQTRLSPLCPCAQQACPRHDQARGPRPRPGGLTAAAHAPSAVTPSPDYSALTQTGFDGRTSVGGQFVLGSTPS